VSQSTRSSMLAVPATSGQSFEFAILCVTSMVFWWQPVLSTVKLALSNDAYTHILLILPVALALLLAERGSVFSSGDRWTGWVLLSGALLLRGIAFWSANHLSASDALSVSILALVLWWIGSAVTCFGLASIRSHLFATCFLFLLIPLPDRIVNWIIEALQNGSAVAAGWLFRLAYVPVARQGIILSIPGLDIEVARECSSIRSSMMLVVVTLLLAHLFLYSRWRKFLLVLAVIPLSVLKNAIRIFAIAELATRVDPSYLDGKLHRHGGILFLTLSILATLVLLWGLRETEVKSVYR
jgi:exosortase